MSAWLIIALLAGGLGRLFIGSQFWVGAALAFFSSAVNGLVIEWEDRQKGGWSE